MFSGITFVRLHHFWHVLYDLQSCGFFIDRELHEKAISPVVCHCQPIASSMLDMTLALIFSQLPHPECWMPRSPSGGSQLLLACFACLVSWCSPGSRVCVVVECVSGSSCYLCICVIGLSQQRFQCTVEYVWHCGHFNTVCIVQCCSLPPSWLKPYWYSAHRYILIQMWCVQNREGRLLLFPSSLFCSFPPTSTTTRPSLSHSVSLFQSHSHRFQSLSSVGRILWSQQ